MQLILIMVIMMMMTMSFVAFVVIVVVVVVIFVYLVIVTSQRIHMNCDYGHVWLHVITHCLHFCVLYSHFVHTFSFYVCCLFGVTVVMKVEIVLVSVIVDFLYTEV